MVAGLQVENAKISKVPISSGPPKQELPQCDPFLFYSTYYCCMMNQPYKSATQRCLIVALSFGSKKTIRYFIPVEYS